MLAHPYSSATAAYKGGRLQVLVHEIDRLPFDRAVYFFLSWVSATTMVTTSPISAISSEPNVIMSVSASFTSTGFTSPTGD